MPWDVGITMLECGCVYSTQTLPQHCQGVPRIPDCWYCKNISDGGGTASCWDYKVHRGFLYNPKTGKITTRSPRSKTERYS